MARSVVERKAAGIESGGGNTRPRQRTTRTHRARASAQPKFRKISKILRATGQAVTSCSCVSRVHHSNISVRRLAVRRYGECISENGVCESAAAGEFDRDAVPRAVPRRDDELRRQVFSTSRGRTYCIDDPEEEGAGGGRVPSPVSFFERE